MKIIKRHYKSIIGVIFLLVLVVSLSGCRTNANTWYAKPYTTWGKEFVFGDEGGFDFGQALLGWPVSLLSYPFAFLMGNIGKALGNSYFWGIVFTTIIVRTIAWPIYSQQNSMQVKMAIIQPEMEKVQRKYAGRTDPASQRQMQQDMMKVYKKNHMNPLGCVFTMIIQFPIFMAMYECVRRIQVYNTSYSSDGVLQVSTPGAFTLTNTKLFGFFEINTSVLSSGSYGVPRATAPQDIAFGITISILFAGIQFLSQKLAQRKPKWQRNRPQEVKTEQQEKQQSMMKMMNIVMIGMFVFMSLSSTALALYWLVGGVYQLGQSAIGRKINERKYYKMKNSNNIIDAK